MPSAIELDQFMKIKEVDSEGLVWLSPLDQNHFKTYGSDFLNEGEYCRLSKSSMEEMKNINPAVSWLATHPAGVQCKFKTDSTRIHIDVTLRGLHDMSHMPATGQCGFDLYVFDEEMHQYVLHNTSTYKIDLTHYKAELSAFGHFSKEKKERDYILNFPLYQGVSDIKIGVDSDSNVEPSYFKKDGRIVVYGTSIAQGGCVSRPGMLYTNILSRWLDMEFLNLGFSGSAFAEEALGEMIGKIPNQKCFIIDVEANAGCDEREEKNLEKFILAYKKHQPNVPIILATRCLFALDRYDKKRVDLRKFYRKFTLDLIEKYKKLGYPMYFLDGDKFFEGLEINFTEFTVDGVHPTDLGHYEMAKYHKPVLLEALKK